MTTNASETVSIVALVGLMAFSSFTLTPTTNSNALNNKQIYIHNDESHFETDAIISKKIVSNRWANYDESLSLYQGTMRDFSPIEQKQYSESIEKLYKPTGVNIFDL